jgi:hypothetical protein
MHWLFGLGNKKTHVKLRSHIACTKNIHAKLRIKHLKY